MDMFWGPGIGSEMYVESDDYFFALTPFLSDLVDLCYDEDDNEDWKKTEPQRTPCSDISYVVEGIQGHRIFKMQWSNVGFWDTDYELIPDYYINMQVWLYEDSHVVEFRYGPSDISAQFFQEWIVEEGAYFYSMLTYQGHEGDFIASINGDPENPTFLSGSIDGMSEDDFINMGLTSFPPANTVYRITPEGTDGVHTYGNMDVTICPNPVGDVLTIYGADNLLVQIFDLNGKLLVSEVYNQPIPVSGLPSGLYMVKVVDDQGGVVMKFVK